MLSPRLPAHADANALTRALDSFHRQGVQVVDLTESNPTRSGICYPAGLLGPLADAAALEYDPHPFGLPSARHAVATDQERRGARVDPAQVVLTASTSEAYSWLFKLLCSAGDTVLVPQPSYPLFEQLTELEAVRAHPYLLEYQQTWSVDMSSLADAPDNTRALLIVSPNNPTGSYLARNDFDEVQTLCRRRGWALIVDEVFADYSLEVAHPLTDIAATTDVLSFSLGGLSKTVGLPQLKLGWMIVGGSASDRTAALASLELIADTFLSVGTPVQIALPHLLRAGASVRSAIHDRIRRNLAVLRTVAAVHPSCEVLRVEGGWSAVVRVPSIEREEDLVLNLLEHEQILVHPGYFFDFARASYLVISLLPPSDVFSDAVDRVLRFVAH